MLNEWNECIISLIYKKGDTKYCSHNRGISFLIIAYRILASIAILSDQIFTLRYPISKLISRSRSRVGDRLEVDQEVVIDLHMSTASMSLEDHRPL